MTMPRPEATALFMAAGLSAEAAVALSESAAGAGTQPVAAVSPTAGAAPSRLVHVPTDRWIHRQRWVLHAGSEVDLTLNQLPVADISALPAVLLRLRRHACFSALYATAASDIFPTISAAGARAKRRRSDGVQATSRVELMQRPPSALSLLFTVPAPPPVASLNLPGQTASDTLIELQLTMSDGDDSGEGVAVRGIYTCWHAAFQSTNHELLARLSGTYAARLVNECQSLPLVVAFLDQHARAVATGASWATE